MQNQPLADAIGLELDLLLRRLASLKLEIPQLAMFVAKSATADCTLATLDNAQAICDALGVLFCSFAFHVQRSHEMKFCQRGNHVSLFLDRVGTKALPWHANSIDRKDRVSTAFLPSLLEVSLPYYLRDTVSRCELTGCVTVSGR